MQGAERSSPPFLPQVYPTAEFPNFGQALAAFLKIPVSRAGAVCRGALQAQSPAPGPAAGL